MPPNLILVKKADQKTDNPIFIMKNNLRVFGMSILIFLFTCTEFANAQQIIKVGAGEYFTSYLTNTGRLHAAVWTSTVPTMRDYGISNVVDVQGAQYTNIALTASGNVYIVGTANSVNPFANLVATDNQGQPFTGNTKVYGLFQSYLSIRNGAVWYWGNGDPLNFNNGENITLPMKLPQPSGKTMIKLVPASATAFGSLTWVWGLASDGTVWQWDRSNHNPIQVNFPGNIAQDIAIVGPMAFVVKTANDLFTWGYDPRYAGGLSSWQQSGVQSVKAAWQAAGCVFPIKEMVGNYNTLHIIDANDNMFASGSNPQGNIGNGVQFSPWRTAGWEWDWGNGQMMTGPVQVPGKFKNIQTSNTITFYLYVQDMGNNWYSWGRNKAMSLGNGKTLSMNNYAIYPEALNVPAPTLVTPLTQTWTIQSFSPSEVPAPLANAGVNQYISSSTSTLFGSGSSQQDGSITSYAWKKISGPSVTIASPTSQNTAISGLSSGTYVFQLTVTSNKGVTATSTVTVVVDGAQAPVNKAPSANAGEDIEIILPENVATLSGTGSDDSRVASYMWTKISGPAGSSFEDATDPGTNVNGLVEGTYIFRLTVTDDGGLTATDDVQLIVSRGQVNNAPTANAGADKTITLPTNAVNIAGSGSDTDGTIASYGWRKISGPTTGGLVALSSASTQATALVQGTYVFELTVTDNSGSSARDSMRVIVNAASNVSPVVNAGADIVVTLPTVTATLRGTASDPDGSISRYQWTKISGPGVNIINATAIQSGINGLVEGVYIFTLTVTDDQGTTASDDVQVTVRKASRNQTPWANAGADKTVTLPTSYTYLSGFGIDPDGTIAGYRWTKASGPANNGYFRITWSNTSRPRVSGLIRGTYKLVLTVTDNSGATGTDTMVLVVRDATRGKVSVTGSTPGDSSAVGKTSVTEVKSIEPSLTVFPNPVVTGFTARVEGFEEKEQLSAQLVSLNGSAIKKMQVVASNKATEIKIDISNLPAGQYVLTVAGSKNKVSQRIVKVSSR